MSIFMRAYGPIILRFGLLSGHSSTQISDFFRRSAELLALICAYVIYHITNIDSCDASRKASLKQYPNRFVGAIMCFSGTIMILPDLFTGSDAKGNVTTALIISLLCVIANMMFWIKYQNLNKHENNAILLVQSRLYRAKSLVDICVTTTLATVTFLPNSTVSFYMDIIGSVIVAAYMVFCGVKTIREA